MGQRILVREKKYFGEKEDYMERTDKHVYFGDK
jgi:hypothetical protein